MTMRIRTLIQTSNMSILRLVRLNIVAASVALLAAGGTAANDPEQAHAGHGNAPRPSSWNSFAMPRSSSLTSTLPRLPTTIRCLAASAVPITGQWVCTTSMALWWATGKSMPLGRKP